MEYLFANRTYAVSHSSGGCRSRFTHSFFGEWSQCVSSYFQFKLSGVILREGACLHLRYFSSRLGIFFRYLVKQSFVHLCAEFFGNMAKPSKGRPSSLANQRPFLLVGKFPAPVWSRLRSIARVDRPAGLQIIPSSWKLLAYYDCVWPAAAISSGSRSRRW